MSIARSFLIALALSLPGVAQVRPAPAGPTTEAEVDRLAVQSLAAFARSAESYKAFGRARVIWERILDQHDQEHPAARAALGYRKEKGVWQPAPAGKAPKAVDAIAAGDRPRLEAAWKMTARKLADLHRGFGLHLVANDHLTAAVRHFEATLFYDPDDAVAHQQLGHGEFAGYRGSDEQIAFVQRAHALRAKVAELKAWQPEVAPVPKAEFPEPLGRSGLQLAGARSDGFAVLVRGAQDDADRLAQAAERSLALVEFVLGDLQARQRSVRWNARERKWLLRLRTGAERDALHPLQPPVFGKDSLAEVQAYGSHYATLGGQPAYISIGELVDDADWVTAFVARQGFSAGANDAFGEGFQHAMTWLLCGSVRTWWGRLPGTEASREDLGYDPDEWLGKLRAQVEKGEDWPLAQLPRERLERFRPQVRIKAWSVVLWGLCRHDERFLGLMFAFPKPDAGLPEQCAAVFAAQLGMTVAEVEEEWRDWVRGQSALAKATRL